LYPQRLAPPERLPVLVILVIAGARSIVAGKNFEALAVCANVNHIHCSAGVCASKFAAGAISKSLSRQALRI
jgi:hypothetical protein